MLTVSAVQRYVACIDAGSEPCGSCVYVSNPIYGGYCAGVPPLPIPNRAVKPGCADGTAMQCGRVGGRLLFND